MCPGVAHQKCFPSTHPRFLFKTVYGCIMNMPQRPRFSMKKILLAEDDTFLASVVVGELGKEHEVRRVPDGEHVLPALGEWRPDLILLDLVMPNMDGFQVLELLRQDASRASIPVLVLTNLGGKDLERAKEMGARDTIVKIDYTPRELHEKINKFLETLSTS